MKKLGFTMSELIIAVGIVGVITAITLPAITNITPDKNKLKVIEYYNKINEINQALLSNPVYYKTKYDENGEPECIGLECEERPTTSSIFNPLILNAMTSGAKYGKLLCYSLTTKNIPTSTFTLDNGSDWNVRRKNLGNYTITIDLDGDKGKNCIFGETGCKTPDTFIFNVDREGNVSAGDALTEAYLLNPTEMHNKQDDFKKAKELLPNYQ